MSRPISRRELLGGLGGVVALAACSPPAAGPDSPTSTRGAAAPRQEIPMHHLPVHAMSASFTAASLRPGLVPMGHVLNVDHFTMSEPTFPPHPHAGFSAVTWMLPWSQGAFTNRDSKGDRSRIAPGALHWTLAGSGMLHEEIPEVPGTPCEGLQIFVKLPEADELATPAAYHLEPDAVPRASLAGGEVRVLVGALGDLVSPIPSPSRTTLVHVSVRGAMTLRVPSVLPAFGLVLRGSGRVGVTPTTRHDAFSLAAGEATFEGEALEVLVGWSAPLPRAPTFRGPFCMFTPERLESAVRAYHSGAMGQLEPSPVRWARPG